MSFYTHDNTVDSPLNNFAALNPLNKSNSVQLSEGNLDVTVTANSYHAVLSTIAVSSGKWYFEGLLTGSPAAPDFGFCIPEVYAADITSFNASIRPKLYGIATNGHGTAIRYYSNTGSSAPEINETPNSGGWSTGTIVSVYADFDLGKMRFAKNGVWYDLELSFPPSITLTPRTSGYQGYDSAVNFGQDHTFGGAKTGGGAYTDANGIGQFYYEPPEGALSLCTANIPSGPINIANDDVPADYMKAVTYTGNTDSVRVIETGFQPDLVWVKQRNIAQSHTIQDSVRGPSKRLETNTTNAEDTNGTYGQLTKFKSTGFEVTNGSHSTYDFYNQPNQTYVAWCWKAAGSPADNQALIIDTDGSLITKSTAELKTETGASITPSKVSANRKSGFSIVKYTGTGSAATVPHGLGKAPNLILIKRTSGESNWAVGGSILGSSSTLYLNLTNKLDTYTDSLIGNIQTSTNFQLGTDTNRNELNGTHIAYCWHSVPGYSKISSYVGSGSADGPFVECGFRVGWLLIKDVDNGNSWWIYDSARDSSNLTYHTLHANDPYQEEAYTGYGIDLLSSGFKLRNGDVRMNGNSRYIFAAFSEQPFNAPATAR